MAGRASEVLQGDHTPTVRSRRHVKHHGPRQPYGEKSGRHGAALRFALNSHGWMKRPIRTNAAAATFDAARKLTTNLAHARDPLRRSSGLSGGSTTARPAANMVGAAV